MPTRDELIELSKQVAEVGGVIEPYVYESLAHFKQSKPLWLFEDSARCMTIYCKYGMTINANHAAKKHKLDDAEQAMRIEILNQVVSAFSFNREVSAYRLKQLFDFNPDTGDFIRKVSSSRLGKAGNPAGSIEAKGYRVIKIDGKTYKAHRLAFLYMEGKFPEQYVDHINGDKLDNRWANLRKVTRSENQLNRILGKNNKTGVKGVFFNPSIGKFVVQCRLNRKQHNVGQFTKIEDAIVARDAFVAKVEHYRKESSVAMKGDKK